jgi:hypothetical protein
MPDAGAFVVALTRRFGDGAYAVAVEQARIAAIGGVGSSLWPEIVKRLAYGPPELIHLG